MQFLRLATPLRVSGVTSRGPGPDMTLTPLSVFFPHLENGNVTSLGGTSFYRGEVHRISERPF